MNLYDFNNNYPPTQNPMMNNTPMMNNMLPQDINYKINELENRIKKIELRLNRLESSLDNNSNYNEPDTNLYMI